MYFRSPVSKALARHILTIGVVAFLTMFQFAWRRFSRVHPPPCSIPCSTPCSSLMVRSFSSVFTVLWSLHAPLAFRPLTGHPFLSAATCGTALPSVLRSHSYPLLGLRRFLPLLRILPLPSFSYLPCTVFLPVLPVHNSQYFPVLTPVLRC